MIKIIHTSDWHLGQRFFGESREEEHKKFLDWLIQIIDRDDIDALIVSGDIFDIKNPPSYARKLYNDFLAKAIKTKCQNIIIIGGNHDSKIVLHEQKKLLSNFGIYIVGGAVKNIEDTVFEIKRGNKTVGIISAIPYLSETELRDSRKSTDEVDRAKALESSIEKYYINAYNTSKRYVKDKNIPIIATGHLSTLSRYSSEAVRDIYIGTLEVFNKGRFPKFNYIALGHYHKRIISNNIAYSGSPITLSFDEANYQKYILEVQISKNRINIKDIKVPRYRGIYNLKGTISEIEERLKYNLTDDNEISPKFVQLKITRDKEIENINSKLEEFHKIDKIKILKVSIEDENRDIGLNRIEKIEKLEDINPEKVFLKKLELNKFNKNTVEQLLNKFIELKNKVELGEN